MVLLVEEVEGKEEVKEEEEVKAGGEGGVGGELVVYFSRQEWQSRRWKIRMQSE